MSLLSFYSDEGDDEEEEKEKVAGGGRREEDEVAVNSLSILKELSRGMYIIIIDIGNLNEPRDAR